MTRNEKAHDLSQDKKKKKHDVTQN